MCMLTGVVHLKFLCQSHRIKIIYAEDSLVNIHCFPVIHSLVRPAQCELFSFADIDEEAVDSRAEVKTFDKSQLKHVETKEGNMLPGAGGKLFPVDKELQNTITLPLLQSSAKMLSFE